MNFEMWWPGRELNPRRQPFQAKMNSDYNNFVARVALEVVDGAWWKQQLRVKSAGSGTSALSSSNKGMAAALFSFGDYAHCQHERRQENKRQYCISTA